MRREKELDHTRRLGRLRIALAAAALLACGPASAALLAIGSGGSILTKGVGASNNNVFGAVSTTGLLIDNVVLSTTAPVVLEFFYLGSESGLKNTLNVSGAPFSHTETDKIPGSSWASATRLFAITINAAGQVPMSFTSSKTGWGTVTPGGGSGGKSIAFAYLNCLTSKSCITSGPSDSVLFAMDDGGGSPDDNDFDDYVGYMVATRLELPIAPSAIPAVPLPAAFWLLGSALLGLVGLGRRRDSEPSQPAF